MSSQPDWSLPLSPLWHHPATPHLMNRLRSRWYTDPGRHPTRLRAAEIRDLEWSQVEFGRSASLHVRRLKNGKPSVHPLRGDEIQALRELRRQFPDSGFIFATERGGSFTPDAVNRLIKRIGERAGFVFPVHCHVLKLTNHQQAEARARMAQGETELTGQF